MHCQSFIIYGYFIAEDLRDVYQYRVQAEDRAYKIYRTLLRGTNTTAIETLQKLSGDLEDTLEFIINDLVELDEGRRLGSPRIITEINHFINLYKLTSAIIVGNALKYQDQELLGKYLRRTGIGTIRSKPPDYYVLSDYTTRK